MSLLRRLGGLVLQRPLGQLAACQAASIHCSSIAEARKAAGKKKEDSSDSESDAEGETPSLAAQRAAAAAQEEQEEWPPALDHSQLRNLDGSVPQQPAAQLVAVNDGRWDVNTLISPALAAELEAAAAGKGSEEEADLAAIQQLHDALEAMERGQKLQGDEAADDDDLRRVAEAIDLYFLAAPEADPEMDGLEGIDREGLAALADTIREVLDGGARSTVVNTSPAGRLPWEVLDVDEEAPMVNWGVDLTEGKAADPWKSALLSEDAKEAMWAMHSKQGWPAEALARHFGIRQQRALAILALKEKEHAARDAGLPLHTELAEAFEELYSAHEVRGADERHHVVLPSFPNYREIGEEDAERLAALLEQRLGKKFEDIGVEDMTDEVTSELLAAAGMDKGAVEEELAAREEQVLVSEFRRNLQYNLGKTGASLSRSSRKKHPPARPAEGWSLLVQPLGKAARGGARQPFVAKPDGEQRELTADEKLRLERQAGRPLYKIL